MKTFLASTVALGLLIPPAAAVVLPERPALIKPAKPDLRANFPMPIYLPKRTASGPYAFYEDSQFNLTNGQSGAVTLSINAGRTSNALYVIIATNRISGNQIADITATFDKGSATLISQSKSGVGGMALYKVTGINSTSVTVTIESGATGVNTFYAHAWSSSLAYTTAVPVSASGTLSTVTLSATAQAPGFFVYSSGHATTVGTTTYDGADAVTENYNGIPEGTSRRVAGFISIANGNGGATKTVTIPWTSSAPTVSIGCTFY